MNTTGFATSSDGTRIAYSRVGSGPPLVLVDGALCYRDNGPARDLARALSEHFTVYTYDRRGRGESGDVQPYAVAREIEDLQAIVSQAGGEAHAFGSSSGAALAMQAVAAGVPIRRLAMYEPPVGVTRPGGPALDEAARQIEQRVSSGDPSAAARYFLSEMLGTPAFIVRVMPFLMRSMWTKVRATAHTLPYDLAILRAPAVTPSGRVPTLVVGGAKSPEYIRRAVEHLAHAIPNARAVLLEGQSHDLSAATKELAPLLVDFYEGVTP